MTKRIAIATGIGVLLAAAGFLPAGTAADTGTVSGKVLFKGTPPPARAIPVTTDPGACGKEQQAEDLVVGPDKGIRYAVVHIVGAKGATAEPKSVEVDQKGCKFNPHVLVVQKGATLDILNSDGITHNIHSHSTANDEFNKNQPGFKKKVSQKFEEAEKVRLSCDVHPWMSGWVIVIDNGAGAVTDASGAFKLANVPPGNYKLEVWQEKLGTQTKDVAVKAGTDTNITFELSRN